LQVAAEALAEAHSNRKESEQLRETQTLLFGAIGVLGVGTLVAAGLAVVARRSQGAALEAAAKQLTEARRRASLDLEKAHKFGVSKFAKDVLDVADNLSRAAQSVPVEVRASDAEPELKALYEGVVMTDAVLLKTFEKHGLVRMEPLGEKFDPNFHDAMFEASDATKEVGTVMHVATPGYMLHERCLRAAGVGVVSKKNADARADDSVESVL